MKYRLAFLACWIFGFTGAVRASDSPASARPAAFASGYSQRVWRIEDGLPQNRIEALSQTPDGYLWIGTPAGLARFDGVRFAIFGRTNTPALTDDSILALRLGRDGALWIGTEGGGLVRYKDGRFQNYSAAEGLTNGFVPAIHEDRAGTIWVGTYRGFFRMEGNRFRRLDGTPEIPLATVISIAEDAAGRIWVMSSVGLLTMEGDRLVRAAGTGCTGTPSRGSLFALHGSVWALNPSGASRLRNGCLTTDAMLPRIAMRSMTEDSEGNLWIAASGRGLVRFRDGRAIWLTAASGLPSNALNVIFEDLERNLWVGCEDGLLRLSRSLVTNVGAADGMKDDNVSTVYPDPAGGLWIATVTGQLYRLAAGKIKPYPLPSPAAGLSVRTVFRDAAGALWFGTVGQGLIRLENGKATVFTKASGLRSETVRQILQDRAGVIWLALDSGVSRWDGKEFTNYYLQDGLSYPSTRCMVADRSGDILVGTDAGLNRIHDGRIVHDPGLAALAGEKIWSIYQDAKGVLWLGTRGGGLLRFDSGRITRFTTADGLSGNSIFQIIETGITANGAGRFWISTSSGVDAVDRKELDTAAGGSRQPLGVVPYGTADGMLTSQMNGGFQPAGGKTAEGDLWFPTVKGAVRIDPLKIPARRTKPVLIERVIAGDRPVPLSGAAIVPPGRGKLEIDFTLCDLAAPQRVNFRYKMAGFDDNWTFALHTRSAVYTNLPPGTYQFLVVATDPAATPSTTSEATLNITLRPSFYRTNWFYGLLALALGVSIWGGMAMYARQTHARYELLLSERTRLAREMHDTVIQGCVGVSTLLEAAAGYRDVDAGEAGKLLDQARTQVSKTLEEARQAVWGLRHSLAAESSIRDLFDLAKELGNERRIQIETEMVGEGSLDPSTGRAILLVGREALRNAVAHANPARIAVRVVVGTSEVELDVTDDGAGFSPAGNEGQTNMHFGLTGMRERVEESGGTFRLDTGLGRGTRVIAKMPLA
jgi:ligand-binding sensor domain-containing protein/signal transduction histidine kinase